MWQKIVLIAVVACSLILALGKQAIAGEELVLHSVKAEFTQEKHLKILVKPLVSHGVFAFQAPQNLRWEYFAPLHSVMLMDQGKMTKFIERDGHLAEDNGMGFGSMQIILKEISSWLDGRFNDNPVFATSQPDARTVILRPKDEGLRAIISSIDLHLAARKGLMDSVVIHEGPDGYTKLTFSGGVVNQDLPASFFQKP